MLCTFTGSSAHLAKDMLQLQAVRYAFPCAARLVPAYRLQSLPNRAILSQQRPMCSYGYSGDECGLLSEVSSALLLLLAELDLGLLLKLGADSSSALAARSRTQRLL